MRAMAETTFHALPALGAVSLTGTDAASFLQGQVTADLGGLQGRRSTPAAWCTPQGRVIALLTVGRSANGDGLVAVLRRELCEPVAERLARYVMRSKVRIELDDAVVAGLDGDAAGIRETPGITVLQLPASRQLLVGRGEALEASAANAAAAPAGAWEARCIALGEPEVHAQTSERWIPQMLNLDLVGGVSFSKGCYPGQEIVARTQHLGRIKRRMFRYRVAGAAPPPGTALCLGGDKVGETVRSACQASATELLAVVNLEAAGRELTDESGALVCVPAALPYEIPDEVSSE